MRLWWGLSRIDQRLVRLDAAHVAVVRQVVEHQGIATSDVEYAVQRMSLSNALDVTEDEACSGPPPPVLVPQASVVLRIVRQHQGNVFSSRATPKTTGVPRSLVVDERFCSLTRAMRKDGRCLTSRNTRERYSPMTPSDSS